MPRTPHPHDDAPDTTEEFRRIGRLPDGPEKTALRQRVVTAWMPMADRLAAQFRNRGEPLEDLRQVAALGLVKAVDRYDPERGAAFASYAVPTVVGELKRHFRDHLWGAHVPRRVQEIRNRVRRARNELPQSLDGRGPSAGQIAERTGLTEEEVRLGLQAIDSYLRSSLDAELPGADGSTLVSTGHRRSAWTRSSTARRSSGPPAQPARTRTGDPLPALLRRDDAVPDREHHGHLADARLRLISRTCSRLRTEIMAGV
ncbi:RNA polymerase sigma factor SigF [Streptomyces olivoverticillatus]